MNKHYLIILLAVLAIFGLSCFDSQNKSYSKSTNNKLVNCVLSNDAKSLETTNIENDFTVKHANPKSSKQNNENYYSAVLSFALPVNNLNLAKITPDFSHSFNISINSNNCKKTIAKNLENAYFASCLSNQNTTILLI